MSPGPSSVTSLFGHAQPVRELLLERSPCFTLGTALVWLGHRCAGGCPPLLVDRRAQVWSLRADPAATPPREDTLVDVAFDGVAFDGAENRLLDAVGRCVRADHIVVRVRRPA